MVPMQLTPYLYFNGQCEEAFRLYEQLFGGKIEAMIPHAGTPAESQVPPEWGPKIMHARLTVGKSVLMGSDSPPGHYHDGSKSFSVNIEVEDPLEAERVFHALAEGGKVTMPIQSNFFAQRFGMVADRFGIPWMVYCQEHK
jgi:PhnB protein